MGVWAAGVACRTVRESRQYRERTRMSNLVMSTVDLIDTLLQSSPLSIGLPVGSRVVVICGRICHAQVDAGRWSVICVCMEGGWH